MTLFYVLLSIYLREAGTRPTGDGKPMGRGPREDSIYMLCLPLKYGSPYWVTSGNPNSLKTLSQWPVLQYGSETWTVTKAQEKRFNAGQGYMDRDIISRSDLAPT